MSLPSGFLDELRSRTSLGQVVGRKVLWDNRKSNQAKGDLWAPCPFHQEKTASFHVDDRKGYYYCFGCHAKGDAISFVRETENVGFMEAVEILARESGMPMPARDPQAQQKSDRRTELADVVEQAVRFYRLQLKTGAGGAARAYLDGRGLAEAGRERFEIGFAPDGWQALWDHLRGKGVAEDLILDAGLARPGRDGKRPYDAFRNRIMFPIRDARGRAIAFGGRAMDPADKAKYINSSDTELFDKGRTLYNLRAAREAAGKGQPLIVAEGYMDVIALSEAGFGAAVAPLGTAITETQMQLLWRVADEPVIALDGDAAGLRAAYRVIDLALPLLEAGKGLRFALMPADTDPDELLRRGGPDAVTRVLDAALPMVRLLWRQETEDRVFDSPERKAALDKRLRDRVGRIRDAGVRRHYEAEVRDLCWQLFRQRKTQGGGARRGGRGGPLRPGEAVQPLAGTRASLVAGADESAQEQLREAVILAAILSTPEVAEEFVAQIETMECAAPRHAALRDAILRAIDRPDDMEVEAVAAIGADGLDSLRRASHVALTPCVRTPGDPELARMTVAEELAKLDAQRGWVAELAEAVEDLDTLGNEAVTWRLGQAAQQRDAAHRRQSEDDGDYDTGPNGARIDRDERSAFDALMQTIRYQKPRR